ncbi:hypothetical protein ACFZWW_001698 [Campylobacter jejuni]
MKVIELKVKMPEFSKVAVFSIWAKKELNIKNLFNLNYNIKERG